MSDDTAAHGAALTFAAMHDRLAAALPDRDVVERMVRLGGGLSWAAVAADRAKDAADIATRILGHRAIAGATQAIVLDDLQRQLADTLGMAVLHLDMLALAMRVDMAAAVDNALNLMASHRQLQVDGQSAGATTTS